SQMPRSSLMTHPLRSAALLLVGATLLLGACNESDAAGNDSTPTATPTVTATPEATPTVDPAGGGIEPANPEEPPVGVLNSSGGSVTLGLGSYCWSPPTGSGGQALCVDKLGIITADEDLAAQPGETLEVSGDLTFPPMSIQSAFLYVASDEP